MPPRSRRQGIAIGTVKGGEELPAADRTQHDEVERGGNGEMEMHDVHSLPPEEAPELPQRHGQLRPESQESLQPSRLGPQPPEVDAENPRGRLQGYDAIAVTGYEDERLAALGLESFLEAEHE